MRALQLGVKISDLKYLTIGNLYDLLDEEKIDSIYSGQTKDFYLINKMNITDGLNSFFPKGD